jgi:dihydrofolate reductase
MIISAIAAMDSHGLIGNGLKLPWHLPSDLKRFRSLTMGKPILMGRRTFESLRSPLPGRLNIVLTRDPAFHAEGCRVARSVEEAFKIAGDYLEQNGGDEAIVIGGAVVFEETASLWDRLYLTVVEGEFSGDVYLPLERLMADRWGLIKEERCEPDARNLHAHRFASLERLRTGASDRPDFDLSSWFNRPVSGDAGVPPA